jgi:hypothetical protein
LQTTNLYSIDTAFVKEMKRLFAFFSDF